VDPVDTLPERRGRVGATVAVSLLVFPACALPIHFLLVEARGPWVLSIVLPPVASAVFARVRGLGWVPAVLLGLCSAALTVGVLIVALVVYCTGKACFE
jgi:hypothetical protein